MGGFNHHGQSTYYQVAAPAGGTLVVEVTVDGVDGYSGGIVVWIGERHFYPDQSGRIRVTWTATPDVKYLVGIGDSAPWDYGDFRLDYRIKAWLE